MSLQQADLEAILGFLVDVNDIEFDCPYPGEVVARLADLVPCDDLGYQEVDWLARRTVRLVGIQGELAGDDGEEEEERYWALGPCPIIQYRAQTGDLTAARLSDVIDPERYHELPIYRDYFDPARIDHMVDLGLPSTPGRYRSFILFRGKGERDFSDRDREVLEVLRPHFAHLEVQAELRHRLSEHTRTEDRARGPGPYDRLTAREREIVQLVSQGKTNTQIAAELWVSPSTVKKHLEHVYVKLGVGRRTAAATYAGSFR